MMLDGVGENRPDLVLTLVDTTTSLRSRARRLIYSVATLGMVRSSSGNIDGDLPWEWFGRSSPSQNLQSDPVKQFGNGCAMP